MARSSDQKLKILYLMQILLEDTDEEHPITMNETIYYSVDEIHAAIAENKKIRFQYFQWNVKKEMALGAKITGPESVVDEVKDEIKRLADQYDG